MTRVRKVMTLFVVVLLILSIAHVSSGSGWTYEDLVKAYLDKDGSQQGAWVELQGSEALKDLESEQELWDYMWRTTDPYLRAQAGDKLLDLMVAGDTSRWNEVTGFLREKSLPRSVIVFQTALVTTVSLLELDSEVFAWKARNIAEGLFDSTKTVHVLRKADPDRALTVSSELRVMGGRSWVESRGGVTWKLAGNSSLPFDVAPLKRGIGRMTYQRALTNRMVFLDSFGQVTSGLGSYVWDLPTGKIYLLRDGNQERTFSVGAGRSGGSDDGNDDDGNTGGGGDDDDDDGNTGGGGDDDDDDGNTGGPGNGNGNEGNPGNGGGNTGGSGPGTGNGGGNNGQGGGSDTGGGGSGNEGNNGNSGGNSDGGPGNGNGNEGNPGNGGGNTGGSGPGTGNGGGNNGQGGGSDTGGGGSGNDNRSGLGDGTNPGNGGGRDNSPNEGTENPGSN